MQVEQRIDINTPSDQVFEYLMAVENRKDYIPALEEVILIDPAPIRVGSQYIEVAEIANRRLETTYQVTELQVNKKITAKTIKSIFPINASLILNENNGITTLVIRLDFQLKGIFKLGSSIVKGIVSLQAKQILEQLKSNLEAK